MKIRAGSELKSASAFSLVEVLVTMVVASILIAALMQSFVTASDSWSSQSKHATAQREARAALRLLADDLSSAVALPSGGPFETDPPFVQTVPTRFLAEFGKDHADSCRMAFLRMARRSLHGPEAGRGDLRLVLYGVVMTDDGGATGIDSDARSQKLVRCEFSPEETFQRLLLHRLRGRPLVNEIDWRLLERPNEPREDANAPTLAVLVHDLIKFDLKVLERLLDAPANSWPEERMPNWVEISLRVTNRQTGRWLRTLADWRGQGERARQLHNDTPDVYHDDPEVRTFAMRMRMPAQVW